MKLYLNNIKNKNILIFDIEYDQNSLVQLALLTLSQVEPNIFEITRSINIYIKQSHLLSDFFKRYTNITDEFLCDNGVDLSVAKALADEVVLDDDQLLVGHGINCDLNVLLENDIDWTKIKYYDTHEVAKELLNRNKNLTVKDIAALDGFYIFNEHNAYADVWGTLHAFCYLNKLQENN